ncbi:MAG: hypothetical protein UY18_C0020G0006 [Microgenomates group bacterium GW2011_GWF2_47_9]|nr:MAG: hypothetical protein UY18_C0020G0006 [Microgenomates group bacterium GW2011_GWF2_47_9]
MGSWSKQNIGVFEVGYFFAAAESAQEVDREIEVRTVKCNPRLLGAGANDVEMDLGPLGWIK